MEQKYLPIGSVCTLKGKNKKIMITGYYSVEFNGNLKINDYMGCAYLEGMLLPELSCTFNHTDIEKVDFIGFKNEEQKTFEGLLNRLTGNDKTEEEKAADFHKQNDMYLTSNSTYSKLLFDENGVVMIADPVIEKTETDTKKDWKNINFDKNGYVISAELNEDRSNPFYKEYNTDSKTIDSDIDTKKWNIFNKIEFDENGTVVSAETNINDKKDSLLNKIEFDENGTVISVGGDSLKEETDYSQYRFDENGTLIAIGNEVIENEVTTVEPQKEPNYKFDENGVLIADGKTKIEEQITAIEPGIPGYVEPQKEANYKFDENGIVVSE